MEGQLLLSGLPPQNTLGPPPVCALAVCDEPDDTEPDDTELDEPHWAPCRGYLVFRGKVSDQACTHRTTNPSGYCGYHKCGERPEGLPFELDAQPAAGEQAPDPAGDYWLSDLGTGVISVISDSDTFVNAMDRASQSSVGGDTKSFEAAVAAELGDPAVTAALLLQVQQAHDITPFRTLAPVAGLAWRYMETTSAESEAVKRGVRDKQGADVMCEVELEDGRRVNLPINVKWCQAGATTTDEGLNRRTWFHGLRTGECEGRNVRAANPSADLLDLYADDFDIQPFEYVFLVVNSDKSTGKLFEARLQGLMSTQADDDGLAAAPHTTRQDIVNYFRARGPLSAFHNVRRSVIKATNRTPSLTEAKLSLLTWWERNTPGRSEEQVQAHARAIRDATPAEIAVAAEAFFAALPPARASTPTAEPAHVAAELPLQY